MKITKIILGVTVCAIATVAAFTVGTLVHPTLQPKQSISISAGQSELTPAISQPNPDQEVAKTGTATLYGKIENIKPGKVSTQVAFRLVEWVNGSNNQEQAALEAGICTLDRIENDGCLPNHFFVRETQKTITLPVSKDVAIKVYARNSEGGMIPDANGNIYLRSTDLNSLIAQLATLKNIPFIFTTTHGAITQIQEQYIP